MTDREMIAKLVGPCPTMFPADCRAHDDDDDDRVVDQGDGARGKIDSNDVSLLVSTHVAVLDATVLGIFDTFHTKGLDLGFIRNISVALITERER